MGHSLARTNGVLTPEVQARIYVSVLKGNWLTTACQAAGIHYHTYRNWQKRWEADDYDAYQYNDFFLKMREADAIAESDALNELRRGETGWQAKAWFLERRFPKKWAKKEVAITSNAEVDLSKKSDDELNAIVKGKGGGRT